MIHALIPARLGSERLPKKGLRTVLGRPMLSYLIERARAVKGIDDVILAIPDSKENDELERFARTEKVLCSRGSEGDVLDRFYQATENFGSAVTVLLYGDGPIIDPKVIQMHLDFYQKNSREYDFVSNNLKTTFPPGNELEVFRSELLKIAAKEADRPEFREHGTLFIRQNPARFRLHTLEAPAQWHFPELELELDTQEDLEVLTEVITRLWPKNRLFGLDEVIALYKENPNLFEKNKNVPRRWKS